MVHGLWKASGYAARGDIETRILSVSLYSSHFMQLIMRPMLRVGDNASWMYHVIWRCLCMFVM